jgi:uncharacterized protein YjbJ (UPF0337 family)
MNSDQLRGRGRNLWGRIKDAFGSLTGDRSTQASGLVDRGAGAVQSKLGDLENDLGGRSRRDPL